MISSAVFLENIKETWKRWCMTVFGLCLIQLLLILSCVPTGKSILLNLEEYFLDPVLQLVSLKLSDPSVSGTLTTVFFGFWVLLLPTLYTLRRAEELVAEGMESGRLISYIVTPLGRENVIRTEAFSLVLDQFSMLAVSAGAGLLFSGLFCSDTQNVTAFLFQSLEAFAVQFVLGGFAFLVSCFGFGKTTRRLLLWGLTGGGFFLYLLGGLGGWLEIPGGFTVFSVLRQESLLADNGGLAAAFFLLLGIVFYGLAVLIFQKKELKFGKRN